MTEVVPFENGARWEALKALALDAVPSPHTRRAYKRALDDFLTWHIGNARTEPLFSKACVHAYRNDLQERGWSSATIHIKLAAIRKLALEASDNGLIDPQMAAGIAHVKGVPKLGRRLGNWLSAEQATALLQAPDPESLTGKRNRAIFGILIGCGLRRGEAIALTLEQVQQRDGRWVLVDVQGKHGRVRSVPMPAWAKTFLEEWITAAGITFGCLFRVISKSGKLGKPILADCTLWSCVRKYAESIGMPKLAPHDLRRTYAKLAHAGGAPLEQIQLSLGHASVQTTERYLGIRQDLHDAPCDHLGLDLKPKARKK